MIARYSTRGRFYLLAQDDMVLTLEDLKHVTRHNKNPLLRV